MDLAELLVLYFKIISKYSDYFIKHCDVNNINAYITGIYILEHVFKFAIIYNNNVIKFCEKCIYYYIEFILQLKETNQSLISLKNKDAFSFIFKKLFKTTTLNNDNFISYEKSDSIHKTIMLINTTIVYFMEINKNIKSNIGAIQLLINKLSKLPPEHITLYYNIYPIFIKNTDNTDMYIKNSIRLINHIKKINSDHHRRIINTIYSIDLVSDNIHDIINQIQ